jgi:hypothetical protein
MKPRCNFGAVCPRTDNQLLAAHTETLTLLLLAIDCHRTLQMRSFESVNFLDFALHVYTFSCILLLLLAFDA